MYRFVLSIILIDIYTLVTGQVIQGTVCDKETGEAIGFAGIYFDGTFTGTTSDATGHFSLDISKYPNRAPTIGAMGYFTRTFPEISVKSPNIICLVPRKFEIKEITVGAKSLVGERKNNMGYFRKEFLGTTLNGRSCEIVNENDITFNYGSDDDTLVAYALAPLQIINRSLGYEITYYMDQFWYDRRSGSASFFGSIVYNKDLAAGFERGRIERRRRNAYSGSCMHFFRTLWLDDLDDTPFKVESSEGGRLEYTQIVTEGENGIKYLSYDVPLDVYYYSTWSRIEFIRDTIPFEETGFYDPHGITWKGRMGDQRAGDWLPYDYLPE
jgi:hypothetical protein